MPAPDVALLVQPPEEPHRKGEDAHQRDNNQDEGEITHLPTLLLPRRKARRLSRCASPRSDAAPASTMTRRTINAAWTQANAASNSSFDFAALTAAAAASVALRRYSQASAIQIPNCRASIFCSTVRI